MRKSFLKDFSWYFIGSFLPILIGISKTPIFTRHFNEVNYGYLGLVLVSFSFVEMILFSWISSCIWRFYPKYKKQQKLKNLYSNLFVFYLIAIVILTTISSFWYVIESNKLVQKLMFLSSLNIIFNQLYSNYIIVIRLEGKAKFYTIFQSLKAFLTFILALIFVFILDEDISALISSLFLINLLAIIILLIYNPSKIYISLNLIDKKKLKELLIYGSAGLLINVCFLIITSSDRYIIAWLGNLNQVGVYDQVYKLSQLSVIALVSVFFNTINPTLIHELETNFKSSKKLIRDYLNVMILIGFPIVFYMSFFSKDIANVFLGVNFREGYIIMPFVFFAAYLHGISNFYELRLKFTNKLKKLSLIIIFVTILNVLLTIYFVFLYGYYWAAITTTITYLILIFLFHFFDKDIINFSVSNLKFSSILVFLFIIQTGIYLGVSLIVELTFIYKLLLIILFILMYIYIFKDKIRNLKLFIR